MNTKTETLDITKLIEVAEEMVHNGMIDIAASGTAKVQDININGRDFELSIIIQLKTGGRRITEQ